MARKPVPQKQEKKQLTPDDMRQGIARLERRLEQLSAFDPGAMKENSPPELAALSAAIMRTLERTFGEDTRDLERFGNAADVRWHPPYLRTDGTTTPLRDYQIGVAERIERSKVLLNEAIRSLKEDLEELGEQGAPVEQQADQQERELSRRVFVVHGREEGPREAVARFLEQMGLEPVILHERANKGRTIITKFREEAEGVGYAVVLLTPDDHGGIAGGSSSPRARQNVVFELGFFIGALGPHKVAALLGGDLERPSDFEGVVYIPLDRDWKVQLARELAEAGYQIDWNKVMR